MPFAALSEQYLTRVTKYPYEFLQIIVARSGCTLKEVVVIITLMRHGVDQHTEFITKHDNVRLTTNFRRRCVWHNFEHKWSGLHPQILAYLTDSGGLWPPTNPYTLPTLQTASTLRNRSESGVT